jgi:hypothetical protein
MYFNDKIEIVVTNKQRGTEPVVSKYLKSVISIHTSNDSAHLGADCELIVPLNARIMYKDGKNDYLTAKSTILFQSGDQIEINTWLEGDIFTGYNRINKFKGWIVDVTEGNPTRIKCVDYIYKLNTEPISIHYPSITIKSLLEFLIKDTGITLSKDVFDFTLKDITFSMMSRAAILESIKKDMGINISLNGSELYCNVASNTTQVVRLQSDRNIRSDVGGSSGCDLQKENMTYQQIRVKAWFENEDGTKTSLEVGADKGQIREMYWYKIPKDTKLYKKLATEAYNKCLLGTYKGSVTKYLYPFIDLFYKVEYIDIRFPDRSGNYVCTGIDFDFDQNGMKEVCKLAFLDDVILSQELTVRYE